MSEYTSFCEHVNKKATSCTNKANYIYEEDTKKYCRVHLLAVFNQFHQSKDPGFQKRTALKDVYGYQTIKQSKQKEPIKKTTMNTDTSTSNTSSSSGNACQQILPSGTVCTSKAKIFYRHHDSDTILCRKHLLEIINTSYPDKSITSITQCKSMYTTVTSDGTNMPTKSTTPKPKSVRTTKPKPKSKDASYSFDGTACRQRILEHIQTKKDTFTLGALLGKGSFGEVYTLIDTATNKEYALKIAYFDPKHPKESTLSLDMIHSEYMVLQNKICAFNNPNIVQLIDRSIIDPCKHKKDDYAYIILEKYYMSLTDAFQQESFSINDTTIKQYGLQLVNIIEYIHKYGVLYIDMKPQNIMFRDGAMKELVLIDFGIFKTWKDPKGNVREQVDLKETEGTDLFACKNLNNKKSSCRMDDLEMIGYILVYMYLQGHVPWENEKNVGSILLRKGNLCCSNDGESLPNYIIDFINATTNHHFQNCPKYDVFRTILSTS